MFTAAAALVAVLTFAYQLGVDNGEATAQRTANDVARVQERASSLEQQVSELEAENAALRSENDRLSAQLADAGAGATSNSEPTSSATPDGIADDGGPTDGAAVSNSSSPEVFRTTGDEPVTVAAGGDIDLDSQEPDWGIRTSNDQDFGPSTSVNSIGSSGAERFAFVEGRPTYEECQAQTVFDSIVRSAQTVVGQHMCVWSSQGRTA